MVRHSEGWVQKSVLQDFRTYHPQINVILYTMNTRICTYIYTFIYVCVYINWWILTPLFSRARYKLYNPSSLQILAIWNANYIYDIHRPICNNLASCESFKYRLYVTVRMDILVGSVPPCSNLTCGMDSEMNQKIRPNKWKAIIFVFPFNNVWCKKIVIFHFTSIKSTKKIFGKKKDGMS